MKYLTLCLLFFCHVLEAQKIVSIINLGIDQGLSNNSINCIYRDHLGFMWFGTCDGLNRFDGYDFKIFRHQQDVTNTIASNWVRYITEDSIKRVWISTRNGANIYNPVTANFGTVLFASASQKKLTPLSGYVGEIKFDVKGNAYIASESFGLLVCSAGNAVATQIPIRQETGGLLNNYYAASITFSADNTVYVSVRGKGIYKYNKIKNELDVVNTRPENSSCLITDNNNNLWGGCDDGLFMFNIKTGVVEHIYNINNAIVTITLYNKILWIGLNGGGVLLKNIDSGNVYPMIKPGSQFQISSPVVFSIYHESPSRTWIGTLRGGVNIIDYKKNGVTSLTHDQLNSNSLINNFTLSCAEDSMHNLWIGTDGGGLSYYNRKNNNFTNYIHNDRPNSLSSNFVTTILNDDKNITWIGTWGGGINKFNTTTKSFEHLTCFNTAAKYEDSHVWSLYEDREKNIWAGTSLLGVLYKLNQFTNQFEVFDTSIREMLVLYEDREQQFWGGSFNTLYKIDRNKKKHIQYHLGFVIRSIYEDAQHNFWIGTEGDGLLLFNRSNGHYISYTEENGLSNNAVLRIIPDDKGNLWLSTFKGISIFNIKTRSFSNIDQSDGLLSNQLSYNSALKLQSGEFMFGGLKGMNIFFPDSIRSQQFHSKRSILLTNTIIDNIPAEKDSSYITSQTYDFIKSIKIPFNKATISLSFVSPEYSKPDKINYAYYLEGWDKNWNYSGKIRVATYTNLHEGSYLFKVKVSGADGKWSDAEQLLKIVVLPPWYRTWAAYLLYVAATFCIIYFYNYFRIKRIKLSYDVAYARKQTENEKELNEKKLSFFTNISHEIRSPLTLIINPLKELINNAQNSCEKKSLNTVYRNAKRLLSLTDQLILFRKAETEEGKLNVRDLNLYELCNEVYECFTQQAKLKEIDYNFSFNNKQLHICADQGKLEIILFNLLSNAFKFSPDKTGIISFIVDESADQVFIHVSDNGQGINEEDGDRIFNKFYQVNNKNNFDTGFGIGLYLVKEFTKAHGGNIAYTSLPGEGTTFTLTLQKGSSHLQKYLVTEPLKQKPGLILELAEDFVSDKKDLQKIRNTQLLSEQIFSEKKTVLIADDNDDIRTYLSEVLKHKYTVQEAINGKDAFEAVLENAPDIIITDIAMPGMDGIELCHKIKTDPALNNIPVILLTASSSDESKLKGIEGGADDYITKPFDKQLLLARIENILKNRNVLQQYFFDTITLKSTNSKISTEYKTFLEQCIAIVEDNLDRDDFSIKFLAKKIGMSHSALYKKIKLISGLTANAFIRFIRLRRAAVLLLSTDTNINEAAFQVGINDIKYFREQFNKLFGMNPSEYIKKYKSSFNKNLNFIINTV